MATKNGFVESLVISDTAIFFAAGEVELAVELLDDEEQAASKSEDAPIAAITAILVLLRTVRLVI